MAEMDDEVYRRLVARTEHANELFDEERYPEALQEFRKALQVIPEPLEDWEASTWVAASIADCLFFMDDFGGVREVLSRAMHYPGALGTPFIHLRLGEAQLELGNVERAKELARAYMGGGPEIFEVEDPKYLEFLRRHMRDI
jgi:tetratricopeptide (TPR) repeat protein